MSNNLSSPISSSQFPQTHIATTSTIHDSSWYLDSGATLHTMPNSVSLSSKSTYISPGALQVGNGTSLPISHIGNSSFDVLKPLHLRNVLLVPSIKKKLISISKFTVDNNVLVQFDAFHYYVKDKVTKKVLVQGHLCNGLYQLDVPSSNFPSAL